MTTYTLENAITNPELHSVATQCADAFVRLLAEEELEIIKAKTACLKEAQAQDKPERFGFTFTVTLAGNDIEAKLGYSVKRTRSAEMTIVDNDQLKLNLDAEDRHRRQAEGEDV